MKVLGLLVGAAVVLGLVLFGIDKLNEPGPTAAEKTGLDTSAAPAPGSDAGLSAECDQAAQEIKAAQHAYFAQNSRYADLGTLLRAGNLVQTTGLYTVESTDGWLTYRLVGQAGCT